MKKILFLVVSIFIATASFATNITKAISNDDGSAKIENQKHQQLILHKPIIGDDQEYGEHYSHSSHVSHESHTSHTSHYSSR